MPDKQQQSRRDMEDAVGGIGKGIGQLKDAIFGKPVPQPPKGNKTIVKPDGTTEVVPL